MKSLGEASKLNANSGNLASQNAFKTIRLIVTVVEFTQSDTSLAWERLTLQEHWI